MTSFTRPKTQLGGHMSKLPTELGLQIDEELFPPGKRTLYAFRGKLYKERGDPSHPINSAAALFATCQAIYDEAKPYFFDKNELRIVFQDDTDKRFAAKVTGQMNEFTTLNSVRKLFLDIELQPAWGRGQHRDGSIWIRQIIAQINGARSLKSLHILLNVELAGDRYQSSDSVEQRTFDGAMHLLKGIMRRGPITTSLGISTWKNPLVTWAYWDMLRYVGATDVTNEVHAAMVKELYNEAITAINSQLGRTWTVPSYQMAMGIRVTSSQLRADQRDKKLAKDSAKTDLVNQVKQLEFKLQLVENRLAALKREEGRRLGDSWPLPKAA